MGILSWILTILGILLSILGILISYVTYSSPMKRFRWYLKRKGNWKVIFPKASGQSEYHQYTKQPEFTIEEIYDRRWERDEPWMKNVIRPDKACHSSQIVLKYNGNVVHTENFMSMDGSRIFVPIPKVDTRNKDNEEDFVYYYDETQLLLSGLLGRYHIYESLEDFCKNRILLDYKPSVTDYL